MVLINFMLSWGEHIESFIILRPGLELRESFLIKTYMHFVGTQKNRLNEKVLLSTQNKC